MKKLFLLLLAVPFFFTGCRIEPYASFHTSRVVVEVGEPVYFTNTSNNAVYFDWEFGDGNYSDAYDPVHTFTATGTFTVTLTAFSRDDIMDRAFQEITVLFPTTLEIEVLEYWDEYPVEDASVILYPSYDDWLDETNFVSEAFTNQNGKAIFMNLTSDIFYVDVWQNISGVPGHYDNYTLADEDIEFIRVPRLFPNEINHFIAYVDFYDDKKSTRSKSGIIRKLERRSVEDKK